MSDVVVVIVVLGEHNVKKLCSSVSIFVVQRFKLCDLVSLFLDFEVMLMACISIYFLISLFLFYFFSSAGVKGL